MVCCFRRRRRSACRVRQFKPSTVTTRSMCRVQISPGIGTMYELSDLTIWREIVVSWWHRRQTVKSQHSQVPITGRIVQGPSLWCDESIAAASLTRVGSLSQKTVVNINSPRQFRRCSCGHVIVDGKCCSHVLTAPFLFRSVCA